MSKNERLMHIELSGENRCSISHDGAEETNTSEPKTKRINDFIGTLLGSL